MLCNVIAESKTQRWQVSILLNDVRSTEREKVSVENQENHHNLFNWSNAQAMFLDLLGLANIQVIIEKRQHSTARAKYFKVTIFSDYLI